MYVDHLCSFRPFAARDLALLSSLRSLFMAEPAADVMPLTEAAVNALERKFSEEIDDLSTALEEESQSSQPDSAEIRKELVTAIQQSQDLLQELRAVHDVLRQCASSGRSLNDDEAAALSYFGFAVPTSRRVPSGQFGTTPARAMLPPLLAPAGGGSPAIQLPPLAPRSASRGASEQPETESDAYDQSARMSTGRRALTPDIDEEPHPAPPPASRGTATSAPTSGSTDAAVEAEVRRRVERAQAVLEKQLADTQRAADERVAQVERLAEQQAAARGKAIAELMISDERRAMEQQRLSVSKEVEALVHSEVARITTEQRRQFDVDLQQALKEHDDDTAQLRERLPKTLRLKANSNDSMPSFAACGRPPRSCNERFSTNAERRTNCVKSCGAFTMKTALEHGPTGSASWKAAQSKTTLEPAPKTTSCGRNSASSALPSQPSSAS